MGSHLKVQGLWLNITAHNRQLVKEEKIFKCRINTHHNYKLNNKWQLMRLNKLKINKRCLTCQEEKVPKTHPP